MPVQPTYPGVYIEEIPSGVRTITGVATSITAFVGRAKSGELDKAVLVNSFAEYERLYGGLAGFSPMSFAVRDFFLNGGSQAAIVRLFHAEGGTTPPLTRSPLMIGTVKLEAANPGKWGQELRGTLDKDVSASAHTMLGVSAGEVFNLTVLDKASGRLEKHRNLTFVASARRIDKVLATDSSLVRWPSGQAFTAPTGTAPIDDAVTTAEATLKATKAAQAGPSPPATPTVAQSEAALAAAITAMNASDGTFLTVADDFAPSGAQDAKKGLYALLDVDLFNILVLPPHTAPTDDTMSGDVDVQLVTLAADLCEKRRAFLLVDARSNWTSKQTAKTEFSDTSTDKVGTRSKNAAVFFPRVRQPNPFRESRMEGYIAGGAVAGVFARTDAQRGVWKAPAGLDATLNGVPQLAVNLTDAENGELNPLGLNCLRVMPAAGRIVWGARTLEGDDRRASEWKYVPVRRTALFLEESLYRGTQWVVFEPNDEPLWAQIRLSVGSFMQSLFRQGAFAGKTPREAYLVKCDRETTTQDDINRGIVNIVVGFAPLKPAEFVIIKLQQLAGQVAA